MVKYREVCSIINRFFGYVIFTSTNHMVFSVVLEMYMYGGNWFWCCFYKIYYNAKKNIYMRTWGGFSLIWLYYLTYLPRVFTIIIIIIVLFTYMKWKPLTFWSTCCCWSVIIFIDVCWNWYGSHSVDCFLSGIDIIDSSSHLSCSILCVIFTLCSYF